MNHDQDLIKELDRTYISEVRIGNGAYIVVKGKWTIVFQCYLGFILIHDVLFIPKIDRNLLSVD